MASTPNADPKASTPKADPNAGKSLKEIADEALAAHVVLAKAVRSRSGGPVFYPLASPLSAPFATFR